MTTTQDMKAELENATRHADSLFLDLQNAEEKLRDRDSQIERLTEALARERDCVLRQQRELNERSGKYECEGCGTLNEVKW